MSQVIDSARYYLYARQH